MMIPATSRHPWACTSQWRSRPKALGSALLMKASASKAGSLSILAARFTILTLKPCCRRYPRRLTKPRGYISKAAVEGIRSLMGPKAMGLSRKS